MNAKTPDSETTPPKGCDAELYPDLAAAGGLRAALADAASQLGLDLGEIRSEGADGAAARITAEGTGREPLAVHLGSAGRRFVVSGWSNGVELVHGSTEDLNAVVRAAHAWRSGVALHDLRAACPFIAADELADAHERGPAEAVAVKWRMLRERMAPGLPSPAFRDLLEAAHAEPKLRQLYPFTSHGSLHFTTCTGFPFSWVVPFVVPQRGGRFLVSGPKRGTVIGEADTPEEAIALVVGNLPPDIGPAVAGTARTSAGDATSTP